MPKLSVIMPTYNGARFLPEQIDSILGQDDDDFELLIIDDGSSDASPDIASDYAGRDARVRVIASSGNLGQNNRLAQLLGEAKGDYVAMADQDDRWAPDRNSRLFSALGSNAMAFGRSELIDGDGGMLGVSLLQTLSIEPAQNGRLRALIKPLFSAHAAIAERGSFSVAGLWSPLPFDWLTGLEAVFSKGAVYVDEAVIFHRIHGGNQINRLSVGTEKSFAVRVRESLLFQRNERLRFWLAVSFLGRSPVLPPATRQTFFNLASRVYAVWFSEFRPLRDDGGLNGTIREAMQPFASDPDDWSYFADRTDVLTSKAFGKPMISEMVRRYRA